MDKYFESFPKEVEIKDAKYIVFIDFGPDMFMRGFRNLEDAQEEMEKMKNDSQVHYLAEMKGSNK